LIIYLIYSKSLFPKWQNIGTVFWATVTYGPIHPIPSADSANIALLPIKDPNFPFSAFHAENQLLSHASIDWNQFSHSVDTNYDNNFLSAYSTLQLDGQHPNDLPFVLDSGASIHISPDQSNFKTLNPIAPHPITGFGGSCIYVSGVGTIDLCTKSGSRITLNHILFVPNSTVHLISVFSLNNDGRNACYFDTKTCSILDSSRNTLLKGCTWVQRRLYILDCTPQIVTANISANIADNTSSSAFYTARTPDLETWHRWLGHCSNHTIINMARQGIIKGMPINLSSAPATCDHCILGKQMKSHVPKMHEGHQATKRLERVFVNLCGPMPCVSKYGHLYSMNIIDDFSSYVWSLPLKSKSEAINVLCAWHCTVENQTREKLKIVITNNGKLVSKTTTAWCALHGIDHQVTAPHTSAQNGWAEQLHRTVLGKAHAMWLSCNAPTSLWDKFCVTSAYLTNLTASSSLNGMTPYELWFACKPSLSHLCEVGCRAFTLIQTHNPKIFQQSTPCVLIGYAPNAKAYCLWDTTTGWIFNSYHVTFIKHLQSQPTDLLLGTTINLNLDTPPSWDLTPVLNFAPPPHVLDPDDNDNEIPNPVLPSFPPILPVPTPPMNQTTPQYNNMIQQTNQTTTQSNNMIPPITIQQTHQTTSQNNNTIPLITIPTITITPLQNDNNNIHMITPTILPPLCHSPCLLACQTNATDKIHSTFLSEFCPLHDTHDLLPLDFTPSNFHSTDLFLSSLSDGSMGPVFDTSDDLCWLAAMCSPEHKYWITRAHKELCNLADLQVFVLIPCSDVPWGR